VGDWRPGRPRAAEYTVQNPAGPGARGIFYLHKWKSAPTNWGLVVDASDDRYFRTGLKTALGVTIVDKRRNLRECLLSRTARHTNGSRTRPISCRRWRSNAHECEPPRLRSLVRHMAFPMTAPIAEPHFLRRLFAE
jgi:hypothetical protein